MLHLRYFRFRLRTLLVSQWTAAVIALGYASYSLERGSWQQITAAVALFVAVFGGMFWVVLATVRKAQSRDRSYEPGSTGTAAWGQDMGPGH